MACIGLIECFISVCNITLILKKIFSIFSCSQNSMNLLRLLVYDSNICTSSCLCHLGESVKLRIMEFVLSGILEMSLTERNDQGTEIYS